MKKHFAPLLCAAALLLTGCAAPRDLEDAAEDLEDRAAGLEETPEALDDNWSAKTHYWQVLDGAGQEVRTIDCEEAVRRVDGLLEGDTDWAEAGAVEGKAALYTYVMMQQKTLLAGQEPQEEREHEEVLRLTVYEDTDALSMTVLRDLGDTLPEGLGDLLTFHLQAPPETAAALRDPAGLAEE